MCELKTHNMLHPIGGLNRASVNRASIICSAALYSGVSHSKHHHRITFKSEIKIHFEYSPNKYITSYGLESFNESLSFDFINPTERPERPLSLFFPTSPVELAIVLMMEIYPVGSIRDVFLNTRSLLLRFSAQPEPIQMVSLKCRVPFFRVTALLK